jgi:hypothetical protein
MYMISIPPFNLQFHILQLRLHFRGKDKKMVLPALKSSKPPDNQNNLLYAW